MLLFMSELFIFVYLQHSSIHCQIYTASLDCITKLFSHLESKFRYTENILNRYSISIKMDKDNKDGCNYATHCHICRRQLSSYQYLCKCCDLCYLTGKFRYALCSICNSNMPLQNCMFMQYFMGWPWLTFPYFLNKNAKGSINIIPKSTAKYLSLSQVTYISEIFQFLGEPKLLQISVTREAKNYFMSIQMLMHQNKENQWNQKVCFHILTWRV